LSCQSWWCGGDAAVEIGRAPRGARVTLACGCVVKPTGLSGDAVPVAFVSAICPEHQLARPSELPPGTPVQIDLLASLLEEQG
jgi:hypothetical protein